MEEKVILYSVFLEELKKRIIDRPREMGLLNALYVVDTETQQSKELKDALMSEEVLTNLTDLALVYFNYMKSYEINDFKVNAPNNKVYLNIIEFSADFVIEFIKVLSLKPCEVLMLKKIDCKTELFKGEYEKEPLLYFKDKPYIAIKNIDLCKKTDVLSIEIEGLTEEEVVNQKFNKRPQGVEVLWSKLKTDKLLKDILIEKEIVANLIKELDCNGKG